MSLFSTMNTAISGMAAQANKLSTIGDNIANSSTTGYKRASTQFETVLGVQATSEYQSGGVQTHVRYGLSEQGTLESTTSVTDLAIKGNGLFVVQDSKGGQALTRAGSFVPDANGNLINAAGYKLMGTSLTSGTSALTPINVSSQALAAQASSSGMLTVNLPSAATAVAAANLPSTNTAGAAYTAKTSLTAYDNLGGAVQLDVYLTKTAGNTWQATVYNHTDAASGGSFPYSTAALADQTLTFDGTTGNLAGATNLTLTVPNGSALTLDLSKTTQLAADFSVIGATVDGRSPSKFDHIAIGTDGVVTAVFANKMSADLYKIALGDVQSPDNLTPLTGNVYVPSEESGLMVVGAAGTGSFGQIDSSTLESSTVDLATELTSMIAAQRGYEANSKILQTSADMLSVVNNLKT